MAVVIPCPDVNVTEQDQCVRFPGGAELCVQTPIIAPDQFQIAKNLLTQANASLAPLAPIFSIVDAILAVKAAIDAIPDSLGPPPDPTKLAKALPVLAEKVAALASLVPQLSVPFLVVDTIDVVLLSLNGIVTRLEILQAQQTRIAAAVAKATAQGNVSLLGITGCAQTVFDGQMLALQQSAAPLNSLIAVVNIFMGLIGQSAIAPLDALPSDPADAIASLATAVETLTRIRNAIPV